MKPIEETHPSLCKAVPLKHDKYEMKAWTENAIQKHTIDRQKVREALDKLQDKHDIFEKRGVRLESTDKIKLLAKVKILEELKEDLGL